MIVYGEKSNAHTRVFCNIKKIVLVFGVSSHIWGRIVVCINCGSMWVETYTRIHDICRTGCIVLTL